MARPARPDRQSIVDATLTLRLTREDRDLLEQLVKLRSTELSHDGIETTAAGYVRGLIRREAAAKGLRPRTELPAVSTTNLRGDPMGTEGYVPEGRGAR